MTSQKDGGISGGEGSEETYVSLQHSDKSIALTGFHIGRYAQDDVTSATADVLGAGVRP